jgi:hypothetical protein
MADKLLYFNEELPKLRYPWALKDAMRVCHFRLLV